MQIVTHLLANAARYTPAGGNIVARLHVALDEVVLEISDSGIGMSPDLLPKAFVLFRRAKELPIGMAQCRRDELTFLPQFRNSILRVARAKPECKPAAAFALESSDS
jgi:hypothetical protein